MLEPHQQALGQLQPLPTVRTAVENDAPVTALAAVPAGARFARSIQQYAVEQLRATGRVSVRTALPSLGTSRVCAGIRSAGGVR